MQVEKSLRGRWSSSRRQLTRFVRAVRLLVVVVVGGVFNVERGRVESEETVVSRMKSMVTSRVAIISVGLGREDHAPSICTW